MWVKYLRKQRRKLPPAGNQFGGIRKKEKKKKERERGEGKKRGFYFSFFCFFLRFTEIRPSNFFGPRSKVVLLIEDYTWALVLRSFDKLREVGVLSYLFYPLFKCFVNVCVGLRP